MKKCFGNPCSKKECKDCPELIDCLMSFYEQPQPSLVLYASDLTPTEKK